MNKINHRWTVIDDLMISITTPGRGPDNIWADCAKDLQTRSISRYLAMGVGELDVSSVQRKWVSEACIKNGIQVAVLTDESIVRGLVTAVSWLGVKISAFPFSKTAEALAHLKVTQPMLDSAMRAIVKLKLSAGVT